MTNVREVYEEIIENYAHHPIHSGCAGKMEFDLPPDMARSPSLLIEIVKECIGDSIDVSIDGKQLVLRRTKSM
ncbi:MAG: hypothetical protein NT076_03695 [Candidatus Pacearchaeota archaeon]|nr:hypothetical protein [Candidatus Pacearchaeota archaeon]